MRGSTYSLLADRSQSVRAADQVADGAHHSVVGRARGLVCILFVPAVLWQPLRLDIQGP